MSFGVTAACAPSPEGASSRAEIPVAAPDPWVLTTHDFANECPALLWNGVLGFRIGRSGFAIDLDGDPLPMFAIGEYEPTGEEKIRALESVLAWRIRVDDAAPAVAAQGYRQSLNMRTGLLETRWQTPQADTVEVSSLIHPERAEVAMRLKVQPSRPRRVELIPPGMLLPIGEHATRRIPGSSLDVELVARVNGRPVGAGEAIELRSESGTAQVVELLFRFRDPLHPIADSADTFEELASETARIWGERWKTDIEIEGPVADQQAVRSWLFYLRGGLGRAADAVSPLGLSGTTYNGHVFWDADIWVFPALALVDPEAAASISRYRLARLDGARENFRRWLEDGRPTGTGRLGTIPTSDGNLDGLMFPWESSVSGLETVPGPSKHQHHIGGSVVQSLQWAADLGLVAAADVDAVTRGVAAFYRARIEEGPEGYELRGTMSPDEHHIGDNDLYTNILVERVLRWSGQRDVTMKRPRDATSLLTYDNDPIRGYKQAAAVLAIIPLQDTEAEEQARAMMARFEDKPTQNGPAMTDSVHATIWARLGEPERAYRVWHESWQPFSGWPLLLFSEKRSRDVTYFTTGAGGSLQTVIYGFLGFRLDQQEPSDVAWKMGLRRNAWLSVKPNLPPAWSRVTLRNFKVLEETFSLVVDSNGATVTKGEP